MVRVLFAMALLAFGLVLPVRASGSLMDVVIRDASEGRALEVYRHDGRRYIAGRPGNDYRITLRNPTGADLLAVVSVDGVNVITGETASWEQSGYIVPAGGEVVVRGWRKSLSQVASFYFTAHDNAYATRTGRPNDVGVIGVAVFRARTAEPGIARAEQEGEVSPAEAVAGRPAAGRDEARAQSTPAAPMAQSTPFPIAKERSLGTGHGRQQVSRARYSTFLRASNSPNEIIAIRYDTYANLAAIGVVQSVARRAPNPFPARFVPDPH